MSLMAGGELRTLKQTTKAEASKPIALKPSFLHPTTRKDLPSLPHNSNIILLLKVRRLISIF